MGPWNAMAPMGTLRASCLPILARCGRTAPSRRACVAARAQDRRSLRPMAPTTASRASRPAFSSLVLLAGLAGAGCGGASSAAPADAGPGLGDPLDYVPPPASCAYDCPQLPSKCAELAQGYACPALRPWSALPHEAACGAFDGNPPTPVAGKCTSTTPSGDAAKFAGKDPADPATTILPEGRRVKPLGKEWVLHESVGGLTSFLGLVPGTRWGITVDTGMGDHVVRIVDVTKLQAGVDPVLGRVAFPAPGALGQSATFVAPDLVYVATSNGVVQALRLDLKTGALARDDARSLKLPKPSKGSVWHVAAIAASPDGKRLVATPMLERSLLVFDVAAGSATFGQQLGSGELSATEAFMAAFDPNDPDGRYAYVTHWGNRVVDEIDLLDPTRPRLNRSFPTPQQPEGLAFLDARWMAVAADLADSIVLIDRVAGSSVTIPADAGTTLPGSEPSTLAYDPTNKRLYATLAGMNALAAWSVDLSAATAPKLTPVGRAPTGWWPSGVAVLPDATVLVANMRGGNTEPDTTGAGTADHMWGSVQAFAGPSDADLMASEVAVRRNNDVGRLAGAPTVSCPPGADDFPVPLTNTAGPSKQIRHVVFVIRENKSFDGVFGDLPGVEGKPSNTLLKTSAEMDVQWQEFRRLARDFAISDNYYTPAELSQQGHFWAVYGRSADVNERTWPTDQYSRDLRGNVLPLGGVLPLGQPETGSAFDWLIKNRVSLQIFGEGLGLPKVVAGVTPIDNQYPGGFSQAGMYQPDVERACYLGVRARVLCDLPTFSFVALMNDHTRGVGDGVPTPASMIAVNDEGTGILLDALSHSPAWASTLVIITEDDPAGGSDHVDVHRTPIVFAGPWVKRGYVSRTHIDVASLHKLYAHLFGVRYPNAVAATAALPFDLFTSTPDYRPWTHDARTHALACGGPSTTTAAEALITESYSKDLDENPELAAQVARALRGALLQSLPRDVELRARARIAARAARSAAGEPEQDDD
jgi:DNA-binding beta-propeller fold protein YncE